MHRSLASSPYQYIDISSQSLTERVLQKLKTSSDSRACSELRRANAHTHDTAAVDLDRGAVDERPGATREEDACARDVLGGAYAAERDARPDDIALLAEGVGHHCSQYNKPYVSVA